MKSLVSNEVRLLGSKVLTWCVFVLHREIELPLHDNGMEPVEFLKSMGISLTPLNEVMAGDMGNQKVF